jgi:predicted GNAT superfamily acetyltransferase
VTTLMNRGAPPGAPTASIRLLTSHDDLEACVTMQRRTWGEEYAAVVPSSIIKVVSHVGGLAAGAFDGDQLIGFVFGITGVENGCIVHWSHMLAVAREAQNRGIGHALKDFQRAYATSLGARAIYWTFDPLVARNAHFNLNVLGVDVVSYEPDMYGASTSPLHRTGTDRFIVSWPVDDAALAARRHAIAKSRGADADASRQLRVEIPGDIGAVQQNDMALAKDWRTRTRTQFQDALARGYHIMSFQRSHGAANSHYVLERAP